MGELSTFTATIGALMNVKEAELMNLPKVKCHLMTAFKRVQSVKMENAGKLETMKVLKEAQEEEKKKRLEEEEKKRLEEEKKRLEEERKRRLEEEEKRKVEEERKKLEKEKKKMEVEKKRLEDEKKKQGTPSGNNSISVRPTPKEATIHNEGEWRVLTIYIEVIVVVSNCCNDDSIDNLDFRRFTNLRKVTVGDDCFSSVKTVSMTGLNKLEQVEIGKRCCCEAVEGSFEVKKCERLKSVKIGDGSFVKVRVVVFMG